MNRSVVQTMPAEVPLKYLKFDALGAKPDAAYDELEHQLADLLTE